MGDTARSHRDVFSDGFVKNKENARIMWPAYSLDNNPFENSWDSLDVLYVNAYHLRLRSEI